jgi:hypothetical protein
MINLDQIVEDNRYRLEAASGQLPESLLALREPDIADVLNRLTCVEAAEVMRRRRTSFAPTPPVLTRTW